MPKSKLRNNIRYRKSGVAGTEKDNGDFENMVRNNIRYRKFLVAGTEPDTGDFEKLVRNFRVEESHTEFSVEE